MRPNINSLNPYVRRFSVGIMRLTIGQFDLPTRVDGVTGSPW